MSAAAVSENDQSRASARSRSSALSSVGTRVTMTSRGPLGGAPDTACGCPFGHASYLGRISEMNMRDTPVPGCRLRGRPTCTGGAPRQRLDADKTARPGHGA